MAPVTFWESPRKYITWASRHKPAILWALVIGSFGPLIVVCNDSGELGKQVARAIRKGNAKELYCRPPSRPSASASATLTERPFLSHTRVSGNTTEQGDLQELGVGEEGHMQSGHGEKAKLRLTTCDSPQGPSPDTPRLRRLSENHVREERNHTQRARERGAKALKSSLRQCTVTEPQWRTYEECEDYPAPT